MCNAEWSVGNCQRRSWGGCSLVHKWGGESTVGIRSYNRKKMSINT